MTTGACCVPGHSKTSSTAAGGAESQPKVNLQFRTIYTWTTEGPFFRPEARLFGLRRGDRHVDEHGTNHP